MKNEFNNFRSVRSLPLVALAIAVTLSVQVLSPKAGAAPKATPPTAAAPKAAAPNGEQIFKENCASCHTGGGNLIDPKKPVKGSAKLSALGKFKEYLLKPSGAMPAAPKIANDAATLDALYKYCKTLK